MLASNGAPCESVLLLGLLLVIFCFTGFGCFCFAEDGEREKQPTLCLVADVVDVHKRPRNGQRAEMEGVSAS